MTQQETDQKSVYPLDGLRVLDLSFYAPGRYASLILADLGADVICVEMPRGTRPDKSMLDDDTTVRWLHYQRNKRSITLNLKKPGSQEVFQRLARNVDVIIESFKPGTAAKLGVDYAAASAVNPEIVYCSISGFGQTGPHSQIIGHEPNYQGMGLALGQNRLAGQPPTTLSALVGDVAGGSLNGLIGLLAALWHKQRTGQGQYVDIAITHGIIPLVAALPYAQWANDPFRRVHFSSGLRADFRPYETKDGRYIAISPSEPWLWKRFCAVIGREDLIDKKAEHHTDDASRQELVDALTEVFKSKTMAEWIEVNDRENVSITPVYETIQEIEQDPQIVHRKLIKEFHYEPLGSVKQITTPIKTSLAPEIEVRWIPRYGQHTGEVLAEIGLGEEVESLRAAGVCE
jgi:crotonobetainyl-CoA:carnitine CoA-transferase CaiB-like acyl-CoA transferase